MIVLSAGEFSTATRIRRYMVCLPKEGLVEQPDVQSSNDNGDRPRQRLNPTGSDERPHLVPIAGEADERKDGKRQLQTEDDLTENQQRARAALSVQAHHDNR